MRVYVEVFVPTRGRDMSCSKLNVFGIGSFSYYLRSRFTVEPETSSLGNVRLILFNFNKVD